MLARKSSTLKEFVERLVIVATKKVAGFYVYDKIMSSRSL